MLIKSVAKIGEVGKEYEKYIANFNTVTAEASTGVVEINKMIADQGDKMTTITDDTRKLVEFFNKVLNDTSLEFSKRAQQAYDKVKWLWRKPQVPEPANRRNRKNEFNPHGKFQR